MEREKGCSFDFYILSTKPHNVVQLGNYFTCKTGVTEQGTRGVYTCQKAFKLRFPWGCGEAREECVGGTQSLRLVGGDFKAKQKYAEFSLAKKHV